QPLVAARVAVIGEMSGNEKCLRQRRMGAGKIGVVVGQLAMLVATGDAGSLEVRERPRPQLAVTTGDAAVVDAADCFRPAASAFPSRASAVRANLNRGLDHEKAFLSRRLCFDFAPADGVCASRKG